MEYPKIETLDDLENALVARKEQRLQGFVLDVFLASFAYEHHAQAVVAEYAGWSPATVKRMAMVFQEMPLTLYDPELPLGVYWVAINHAESPEQARDLIRRAINGGWSVADAKEALGIQSERTAAPRFKATLKRNDDGEIVVTPDETPPHWFDRAEVREVVT